MNLDYILLGTLLLGGGAYMLVCPEKMWKITLYFRSLWWPNREPMDFELFVTRIFGGGLVLFGLLLCFGYV